MIKLEDKKMKITRNLNINTEKLDDDRRIIAGYAAIFNSETMIGAPDTGFHEVIEEGAFNDSINKNPVLALYNHDFNNVLGRVGRNLKIWEDSYGLGFELELLNTQIAEDLYKLVKSDIISQCSFSGWVDADVWEYTENKTLRRIKKIDLMEITITPIPAYEDTIALARAKEFKGTDTIKQELMRIAQETIKNI